METIASAIGFLTEERGPNPPTITQARIDFCSGSRGSSDQLGPEHTGHLEERHLGHPIGEVVTGDVEHPREHGRPHRGFLIPQRIGDSEQTIRVGPSQFEIRLGDEGSVTV